MCPKNNKTNDAKIQMFAEIVDIPDTIDVLMGSNASILKGDVKELLGECFGMVVLVSGCSKTVCGETWFNVYLDTLNHKEKDSIVEKESRTVFKFGDGKLVVCITSLPSPNLNLMDMFVKKCTQNATFGTFF